MKPENNFDEHRFREIHKAIEHAKMSPFWQRKIGTHIIKTIKDFQQLPITTRDEVNEVCDKGNWIELLTTLPKKSYIKVTSGGRPYRSPFVSYLSSKEFGEMSQTIMSMFQKNRIDNGRILVTFPGVMPYPNQFARMIKIENPKEYVSSHISGILFKHACIQSNLETYCSGLQFLAYKISKDEAIIERDRIMKAYFIAKPDILAVSPNVLRNVFLPELEEHSRKFVEYNTKILISGGQS